MKAKTIIKIFISIIFFSSCKIRMSYIDASSQYADATNFELYNIGSIKERNTYYILKLYHKPQNIPRVPEYAILYKNQIPNDTKIKKGKTYQIHLDLISSPSDADKKIYYLSPNEKDKVVLKGYWQQLYVVKEIKEINEVSKSK